ncbi:TetR/AcrR family transcriptional regulator [Rugosimonospora africana]|uniref:TetR family transcriptional regulator n=1 Tax=Rugosimonospora africana TaxID=556532 RepID=A0A8J3QQX5_9ACTN|nr:TetR/AcrR family transcriptional regulator C-terminal domain-containing protein [Rugosimonospora africana]GIH14030.1 TetR family transcriptional regulator [Rugosimonospora africana]
MPRPRSLTQPQLAAAALAVIDRDGLGGLTMRAVADQLGMSTMALYRYVRDREELERLVVELVLEAVDPSRPTEDTWRRQIEVLVGRIRDAIGAHPAIVPLTLIHRQSLPAPLRWGESVLAVLADAGVEAARRPVALRGLMSYVVGAIQLEHLDEIDPAEGRHRGDALSQTARHGRTIGPDEEFGGGLAILLDGLRL